MHTRVPNINFFCLAALPYKFPAVVAEGDRHARAFGAGFRLDRGWNVGLGDRVRPGKYHDGVYIRPHFLDHPGQTIGGPLLLPPDDAAAKAKEEAPGRILLEPETVPPQPQPAS